MQSPPLRSSLWAAVLGITVAASPASMFGQHYKETKLVSDQSGLAAHHDANLVNPWGLSRSSGSPWWVSDNGTGVSTLYDGTGKAVPLVVTIPPSDKKSKAGTPTGTVFNGSQGFELSKGNPAFFIFVTEDGTISGWNPKVNPTQAVIKVNHGDRSVYKGVTIATAVISEDKSVPLLYAADFRQGRIEVYDQYFHPFYGLPGDFRDPELPRGYAPFNIQNIGGNLYVGFALQDSARHDEVDGQGLGYVDIFSPQGRLLQRLQHGSWFNAPWGLTLASSDFGIYSHDLLVGQFGSGEILVFNPVTGRFKGRLRDANNAVIKNEGLWGLSFGNGAGAGPANTLFISAGTNHEQNGAFSSIVAIENPQGGDQ